MRSVEAVADRWVDAWLASFAASGASVTRIRRAACRLGQGARADWIDPQSPEGRTVAQFLTWVAECERILDGPPAGELRHRRTAAPPEAADGGAGGGSRPTAS